MDRAQQGQLASELFGVAWDGLTRGWAAGFPTIRKQSVPMKPFVNQNGIKKRSNYFRTHLAKECTDTVQRYGGSMMTC